MGVKGLNDAGWECISGFAASYVQESFREVACKAISKNTWIYLFLSWAKWTRLSYIPWTEISHLTFVSASHHDHVHQGCLQFHRFATFLTKNMIQNSTWMNFYVLHDRQRETLVFKSYVRRILIARTSTFKLLEDVMNQTAF